VPGLEDASQPPSADGPQGAPRRSRRGSGRKLGNQPGAPDSTLTLVEFTAFSSRRSGEHIRGRPLVRRGKRVTATATTKTTAGEQQELFTAYRYHASRSSPT
jgi:hypothetical protein